MKQPAAQRSAEEFTIFDLNGKTIEIVVAHRRMVRIFFTDGSRMEFEADTISVEGPRT